MTLWAWDIECLSNYFLVMAKSTAGEIKTWESDSIIDWGDSFDDWLRSTSTVAFNSIHYDLPMIMSTFGNFADVGELKQLSDSIIGSHKTQMEVYGYAKQIDHIDLLLLTGGFSGLKVYGSRMHSKNLKEMPQIQTREEVKKYCLNDLDITLDLYNTFKSHIEIRKTLSKLYNIPTLQYKEPGVCEKIMSKLSGVSKFDSLPANQKFKYEIPDKLKFDNIFLKGYTKFISQLEFEVVNYRIVVPPELKNKTLRFGGSVFNCGIGGMHSREKNMVVESTNNIRILNIDVSSYYPMLMLNYNLGGNLEKNKILDTYRSILKFRMKSKKSDLPSDKKIAQALKLPINSATGKLNSKYSILYNPKDYIQMTIGGQLHLIKLMELLMKVPNTKVCSANTDGIVITYDHSQIEKIKSTMGEWENLFNFELEYDEWKCLYSRDVNNYFAITMDGKIKVKGIFADEGVHLRLEKNPRGKIIYDSIIAFVSDGIPIERTIRECKDITKFVFCQRVTSGAMWKSQYLGQVIRFIYTTDGDIITRAGTNHKVSESENAFAVQKLPNSIPQNLYFEKYIEKSEEIYEQIAGKRYPRGIRESIFGR